jgi:hypothetical protein
MDDGRVLTAAEAEREPFPERTALDDDLSDIDDLVALIDKIAAPGRRF